MAIENVIDFYFQLTGKQLSFSSNAKHGSFVADRNNMHSLYALRYNIWQEQTGKKDAAREDLLHALANWPEEKVFIHYLCDDIHAVIFFTDLNQITFLGSFFSDPELAPKITGGMDVFHEVNVNNLLAFVDYLVAKKTDPTCLIAETEGDVEVSVGSLFLAHSTKHPVVRSLNFNIHNGSVTELIIHGSFDLTVASLMAKYRSVRRVYVPYDRMNVYVFNEDAQYGDYELMYWHFIDRDPARTEDQIKVNELRIQFPEKRSS